MASSLAATATSFNVWCQATYKNFSWHAVKLPVRTQWSCGDHYFAENSLISMDNLFIVTWKSNMDPVSEVDFHEDAQTSRLFIHIAIFSGFLSLEPQFFISFSSDSYELEFQPKHALSHVLCTILIKTMSNKTFCLKWAVFLFCK